MTCRIVLVHGFNVRDPANTVGRLQALLTEAGFDCHEFRYGWAGLLGVRFGSNQVANSLVTACEWLAGDGPIVAIGHSNGCNLINRAAWIAAKREKAPPFRRSIYLSPALDRAAGLAPQVTRCDVFHTQHDSAVNWARWLPRHPWGDMGRVGYTGADYRYRNINGAPMVRSHSGWFTDDGLTFLKVNLVQPLLREFPCEPLFI